MTYPLLILRPPVAALEKRIAFQKKSFHSHFTGTSPFTGDTPCPCQSFRIAIFFYSPVLSIESLPTPHPTLRYPQHRGHPAPHALCLPPPPTCLFQHLPLTERGVSTHVATVIQSHSIVRSLRASQWVTPGRGART